MTYELKHIHGIPTYVRGSAAYTFELQSGQPSDQCVEIGRYDTENGRIEYFDDWRERVQPHLDAFRAGLVSHARDAARDAIIKPQKPRKAARNTRKPASRAANPESL